MQRSIWLALGVILSFSASSAFSEPELKGTPHELKGFLYPEENTVTIFAESKRTAYADVAILTLVVTTEDAKLSRSLAGNAEIRKHITKALVDFGLDPKAIQSSEFSTTPEYGWFSKRPINHKVINRMAIKIGDESQLMQVAVLADEFDEVEFSDTVFQHSQKQEAIAELQAKALERVMAKKRHYEKMLGLVLRPIGFRDASASQQPTRGALLRNNYAVTPGLYDKDLALSATEGSFQPHTQTQSFDEVEYQVGGSVDFQVKQALSGD